MTALDWPADLAEREAAIAGDDASTAPPFAAGDRIYCRSAPERGSLIVDAIDPYATGDGWLVRASGRSGFYTIGPAEHLRRCPTGWTEPPLMPAGRPRLGLSEAARVAARDQDDADPQYRAALAEWHGAMRRWLAWLENAA